MSRDTEGYLLTIDLQLQIGAANDVVQLQMRNGNNELDRVFQEGQRAFKEGKPIDANPQIPAYSLKYTAWEDGWQAERKACDAARHER